MATQTLHYHLTKPASADRVAVGDINDNSDIIDGNLFTANERADQMADDYNASETYNTGDYVRRENYLYKCNTDNTTGTWDVTKWDRVKVMEEITQGGGGGSSTLAGLNDVNISSPSTGQALIYNSTTQKWENGAGGGGSSTLAGLTDVSVTGASNKDTLSYNSTSQKWEKSSRLTDLELTVSQMSASTLGITEGHHILKADGTQMAQEEDLQFIGVNVADDNANGKTVVTTNIDIEQADYDVLVANDADLPGVNYNIIDAQPVAVNASNLPYDSTHSVADMLDYESGNVDTSQAQYYNTFINTTYSFNVLKVGNVKILNFSLQQKGTSQVGSWYNIGKLPNAKYYPTQARAVDIINSVNRCQLIRVDTVGDISIDARQVSSADANAGLAGQIIYV